MNQEYGKDNHISKSLEIFLKDNNALDYVLKRELNTRLICKVV